MRKSAKQHGFFIQCGRDEEYYQEGCYEEAGKMQELHLFAEKIFLETLKIIGFLEFNHLGGSMSMLEVVAVIYEIEMKVDPANSIWKGRKWFVLSKDHIRLVIYVVLGLKVYYSVSDIY